MAEYMYFPVTAMDMRHERWTDLDIAVTDAGGNASLLNNVTLLRPLDKGEAAIAAKRAVEFFDGPKPRRFSINSFFDTDFTPYGYSEASRMPAMYREPGGQAPAKPAELQIERVRDVASLQGFEEAFINGFPQRDFQPYVPEKLYDPRVLGDDRFRLFVGWLNDKPVSSATAFVSGGLTQVYNIATLESLRGRGYGTALTWSATLTEPTLPAVLQASESGSGLYKAMGFKQVCEFVVWRSINCRPKDYE